VTMSKAFALGLILISLIALCAVTFVTSTNASRSIIVPDDYSTIYAALTNAENGDTIYVKKGTYNEKMLTINKSITLIGEDPNSTIINNVDVLPWIGDFPPSTMAIQIHADNIKISNFTIVNASTLIAGECNEVQIEACLFINGNEINLKGNQNTIAHNNISGISNIALQCSGQNNNIVNNIVNGISDKGVVLSGDNNIVKGNYLNNSAQIEVIGNKNTISNNTLNSSGGILIQKGSFNIVCLNRISYGGGIVIVRGINNTFYANNIKNGGIGVDIGNVQKEYEYAFFGPLVANNTVYHNNFINNQNQVYNDYYLDDGDKIYNINSLDNGKEGNYWSDYVGVDSDGNGISDTPYVIDANRSDRYPLMFPFDIDNNRIVLPSPLLSPAPSNSIPILSPLASPSTSVSTSISQQPAQTPPMQQQNFPISGIIILAAIITLVIVAVCALVYKKHVVHF